MKLPKECCVTTSVPLKERQQRVVLGGGYLAAHAQGIVPLPGVKEELGDAKIGNQRHGPLCTKIQKCCQHHWKSGRQELRMHTIQK